MHQADGSLADDQNRVIGREVEQLDAFEHGVDRLDEGCLLKGHAVGNRDHAAVVDDESMTRMYSAKPPPEGSKPAVAPVFL